MSEATFYREFRMTGRAVWQSFVQFIREHAKSFLERGKPLRVIVTDSEKHRSSEQNARYWAILSEIAEKAGINGQKFSREVWHEYYARIYLPLDEVILPDGEIIQRRVSTTSLKVPQFSNYMNQVEAHAATELNVEFD